MTGESARGEAYPVPRRATSELVHGVAIGVKVAENLAGLEANTQLVQNSFAGMVAKTRAVDEAMTQIALYSNEQGLGIKQITHAMTHRRCAPTHGGCRPTATTCHRRTGPHSGSIR